MARILAVDTDKAWREGLRHQFQGMLPGTIVDCIDCYAGALSYASPDYAACVLNSHFPRYSGKEEEDLWHELAAEIIGRGISKNRIAVVSSLDDALRAAQGEGFKTYHKERKREIAKHWSRLPQDLRAARLL